MAGGSLSHFFAVAGALGNTICLNATEVSVLFGPRMLRLMLAAEQEREEGGTGGSPGLDVVIIGGGATGVELAAELREASSAYVNYGFDQLDGKRDVRITILEGAPRVLAPLPEKVS